MFRTSKTAYPFDPRVQGLHWSDTSPTDGQTLHQCSGDTLVIPWNFILDQGETVKTIHWYFHGRSDVLIAVYSYGNLQNFYRGEV